MYRFLWCLSGVVFSCLLSTEFSFYSLRCTRFFNLAFLFLRSFIPSSSFAFFFFVNSFVPLAFSFQRRLSSLSKVHINDERAERLATQTVLAVSKDKSITFSNEVTVFFTLPFTISRLALNSFLE